MRGFVALVVAVCALGACGSGSTTFHALPVPPGTKVGLTVRDGPRSWSILEDGECLRLQIRARGRRYLSDARCPGLPFTSTLSVTEAEVRFNDRDVTVPKCPDNCPPSPPDVTMSAPVVWGRAAPEAGFVCVAGASGSTIIKPRADGLVLAPVAGALPGDPDALLSFLPDGRFIGSPGPPSSVQPPGVDSCRAAGAPGRHPLASRAWPFAVDVPRGLSQTGVGIMVSTDTGYSPDGAALDALAGDHRISLRLHPDTRAIGVSNDGGAKAAGPTELRLPRVITDALAEPGGCAVWRYTIVLRLDEQLRPHLGVHDNGRRC